MRTACSALLIGLLFGPTVSTAQTRSPKTVVVDSWWSGDYAQKTCEAAAGTIRQDKALIETLGCAALTSCAALMPRHLACTSGHPKAAAHDFEDELLTQFAILAICKGAMFARYRGPDEENRDAAVAMNAPHWALTVDYIPGSKEQEWTLMYGSNYFKGRGATPRKVGADICAIVNGHDGGLH